MSEKLLEIRSLSKSHGHLKVLDEVSFDLQPGEILGLVGRRGSGKSTLLNLIGGAIQPSGGEIILSGEDHTFQDTAKARQGGIELVYQTPQLLDSLDIVHNIFFGHEVGWLTRVGGSDWERMYSQAKDILAGFELRPVLCRSKLKT